ncbi:MAG: XRE family transcriptional regulator [Succinivibrio sp.]
MTAHEETIGERIKNALYEKRMTGFELAKNAGISEGGLSQIINGKIKNLKVDTALRLAKALEVPPMWIITGDSDSSKSFNDTDSDEYFQIPRYEVTYTKEGPKFTEFKYDRISTFHKSYFSKYGISSPKYCKSFKVLGDSMEPLIRNGDYVVVDCDPNLRIVDGDIYAFCDSKGLHVKRIIVPLRGGYIIRSDNHLYEDEFLSKEDVSSIYLIGHVIDRQGSLIGV